MKISDKKFMTWLVFISIVLGLLMIVAFKPDHSIAQAIKQPELEPDFSDLFSEFEPPESEETFINEKIKQENNVLKEAARK